MTFYDEVISKMSFGLPPFGGIDSSFQILDNQQVARGMKRGLAARVPEKPLFSGGEDGILNQNPIFETASCYPFWH
jgi:hypothetical protein